MTHLPEPRRFGGQGLSDELLDLAARVRCADPLDRSGAMLALRRAVERCLAAGDEARWQCALAHADSDDSYRILCDALGRSIASPLEWQSELIARPFALPLVFVTACSRSARVPGTLPDIEAIQRLFERSSALGPTRSFGFSNALCSLEALEALSPVAMFRSVRSLSPSEIVQALLPADIALSAPGEHTQLRLLIGASLVSTDAPGFTETAANIGFWGRELGGEVARQLRTPEVQMLVLPRPPQDLISAAHAGRWAQLEAAFNLFASNAVRRLRSAVGEPTVIVSAHRNADIRVTLSSPFAPELAEGFHWPLHPRDELAAVEATVRDLFADMRVGDIRVLTKLLPAARENGAPFYPRSEEFDALCAGSLDH